MRNDVYGMPIVDGCPRCETQVARVVPVHRRADAFPGLQFPVVLVDSVVDYRCARCDELLHRSEPKGIGLAYAVARARILMPHKLSDPDVVFLSSLLPSSKRPSPDAPLTAAADRGLRLAVAAELTGSDTSHLARTVAATPVKVVWPSDERPTLHVHCDRQEFSQAV